MLMLYIPINNFLVMSGLTLSCLPGQILTSSLAIISDLVFAGINQLSSGKSKDQNPGLNFKDLAQVLNLDFL